MIIGIDMGGTHCDGVVIKNMRIYRKKKELTRESDVKQSVLSLLKTLIQGENPGDIRKVMLSTTLVTNTLSKNQEEKAGLFIVPGLGAPVSLVNRKITDTYVASSGYVDHRGIEVSSLKAQEMENAHSYFSQRNIKNLAVVSKFSPRNQTQEKKAKEFFDKKGYSVFMGSGFSGKLNFPRRCMTAYLTASVFGIYRQALQEIENGIRDLGIQAPVYILKADGGAVSLQESLNYPVESVLSGPAASIMGGLYTRHLFLEGDAVVLDIGGTTTDLGFFINGDPLLEPLGIEIKNLKTLVRALKVYPVPLGGDTLFEMEKTGEVTLNNRREGVAYAFGGPRATLTDVFMALNEKHPKALEGVGKQLSQSSIPDKIQQIGNQAVDFLLENLNRHIEKINSRPIYTINEFFQRKVFKPSKLILIGGAAPYFQKSLQEKTRLEVLLPDHFEICNAIGAALSRVTAEVNLFANTADGSLSVPETGFFGETYRGFSLQEAKETAVENLRELARKRGLEDFANYEITEASTFNMVRGFSTSGKNIRVRAQIKPGLITEAAHG